MPYTPKTATVQITLAELHGRGTTTDDLIDLLIEKLEDGVNPRPGDDDEIIVHEYHLSGLPSDNDVEFTIKYTVA